MKSTKVLTILLLLFISTTIFAQKVHYKDSYYTIVKSKIFHRGHDVYGQLTPGKIDTIHTIAKELYNERGKLKDKYKNRKRRDRYKLPESFWEQKSAALAEAGITTKVNETTAALGETKNNSEISQETIVTKASTSTTNSVPKITEQQVAEKAQKEEITELKKAVNAAESKKVEKDANKDNVAKLENEKQKKIQKKEIEEPKKTTSIVNNRASKKEENSARQDEKMAVEREKHTPQKERAAKKAKNSDSKQLKGQENKAEKLIVKEKRKDQKSVEKIEKQQSQEAEKLKNRKKDLEKEQRRQIKKQKSLKAKEVSLLNNGVVSTSLSKNDTFGTIYIKVNKEKTSTTKSGAVLLFFDVINNSNKDLVILKPNNSMDNRLDFFSNTTECADIPILATDYIAKDVKIKNEDYLTIPANAKIELFINGNYRSWLVCNSEDIILQIEYNPFKNAEEGTELQTTIKKEISKSLKRITPIKIESENIKFKLNKQE